MSDPRETARKAFAYSQADLLAQLQNEPRHATYVRRVLTALGRFENSPAGQVLGLAVLFSLAVLPLALNEGGLR